MQPFYLVWKETGSVVHDSTVIIGSRFPVNFPGRTTPAKLVSVTSSALATGELRTLQNLRLYVVGEDADLLQLTWPTLGGDTRSDLAGGVEISMDGGQTYVRFSATVGYAGDSSTWLPVPAASIGLYGIDGQLGPYDTAHFTLRLVIPPAAAPRVYNVRLEADFDVL